MVNMEYLTLGLTLVIVGITITFLVLIILSEVIYFFGKYLNNIEDKKNKKAEEKLKVNETQIQEKIEKSNNSELTAMIIAAYFHIYKDAVSLINLQSKVDNWKLLGRREQMERL